MISWLILFTESILLVLSLGIHVLWWRFGRPRHQALTLIVIFSFPLLALLGSGPFLFIKISAVEMAAVALLHFSLTCAYLQTYPVLQALSPSLLILLIVGDAGPEGLSEKEVLSHFGPKQLLEDRIEDLLDANLAYESGSSLQLTTTGQLTVFLLTNLRKILGLPPGQG